jgi:hypothetical protein
MIDLSKLGKDGGLMTTILEAIIAAAKAAGEPEAAVLARVNAYLAEIAKDETDPLLASILADYPEAGK